MTLPTAGPLAPPSGALHPRAVTPPLPRSFLTECLAGPLVGGDPRLIHRFSDLYQAARHSYRAFGEVEQRNFHNLLLEIRSLVASNTADRPRPVKKAVTPQHRKALNRPRRRLAGGCGEQGDRTVAHRNSTAVLISAGWSCCGTV